MNFADRVKETTTSTSAAVIVLGGAVAKFRSFASSLAIGDTGIPVSMDDGNGNWENGAYTLTNATTLTRTAIYASSNGGAPTAFPAGTKEVFCTLASEALNELVEALRAEIGAGNAGVRDIPFAVSVPLSTAGQAFMPQTAVTGALTFTPAAAAVRGALVYLRLVADGANLPNFAAFKEWGGSLGYDNRAGIANQVQFFCDGTDSFVSISQAIGAVPLPIAATAVTMTGPTAGVVGSESTVFTVGTNGTRAAAVTVTPTPVTGVTFSPSSVTLPIGSATASFTATPTTTGAKTIAVTNSAGLTNPAAITYTVADQPSAFPRMGTLLREVESGTGPYTYTGSGAVGFGGNTGDSVGTTRLLAGVDGSMTIKLLTVGVVGGNEVLFGIDVSSANLTYQNLDFAVIGHTDGYQVLRNGTSDPQSGTVFGAVNDLVRFTRSGATGVFEVSKNSGSTWVNVGTYSVPTGAMYFHGIITFSGAFQVVATAGLG